MMETDFTMENFDVSDNEIGGRQEGRQQTLLGRQKASLCSAGFERKTLLVMGLLLLPLFGECVSAAEDVEKLTADLIQLRLIVAGQLHHVQEVLEHSREIQTHLRNAETYSESSSYGTYAKGRSFVYTKESSYDPYAKGRSFGNSGSSSYGTYTKESSYDPSIQDTEYETKIMKKSTKNKGDGSCYRSDTYTFNSKDRGSQNKTGPVLLGTFSILLIFSIIAAIFFLAVQYRRSKRQQVAIPSREK